ncbi:MAG: V-type ATP synthase subunit E family protein [Gammaproteobacteria bacterium]
MADAQLQHLLALVERDREARCREVTGTAEQQARAIVRQAHRDARAHAHQDLEALREQIRQRVISAQAQEQTRLRQLRQQADQAFLDAAWQPLQEALQRHWQEPAHRQQWIAQLVEAAAARLIGSDWLIEHPPDWPADERVALKARVSGEFACHPRLQEQPGLRAGLRISADEACVDGSIDGLLRRRTRIEALLLAEIARQRGSPG